VRRRSVWTRLLGVEGAVVENVRFEEEREEVVATVRPARKHRNRCSHCGRRAPRYDQGDGVRRWRALDLGTTRAFVEAGAPRVRCKEHGVVVAAVPWARRSSGFTRKFEDQAAWLATHVSKTAISELLRIAWRSVGSIIARVASEAEAKLDRLANLTRIGIDELSYRKGHRYITVVIDHDTGRLLWANAGRDEATLDQFFDLLGPERSAQIQLVSADAAPWIANVVARRCPRAVLCLDPYHIVAWATAALDEVRRKVWNDARRSGKRGLAVQLKGSRYALWKNPEDLTGRQEAKLAIIARLNRPLYTAYLLKEQLRQVFRLKGKHGRMILDSWLVWARRSRLPAFVKLAQRIGAHRAGIDATLEHGLSNARIEAKNTQLRLITRRAFGFGSAEALIGLAMLKLGGLCPPLPGR
jgi:transposase